MVKTSYKQLKVVLASSIRKLGLVFIILKLGEFLLFDNFLDLADFLLSDFYNLDNFEDLEKFWAFNFSDFLVCLTPLLLILYSLTLLLLLFYWDVGLLPLFLPRAGLSSNLIIFSIKVSRAAILLKLWINH